MVTTAIDFPFPILSSYIKSDSLTECLIWITQTMIIRVIFKGSCGMWHVYFIYR